MSQAVTPEEPPAPVSTTAEHADPASRVHGPPSVGGFRFVRAYATTFLVIFSYVWFGARVRVLGRAWRETHIAEVHTRNARRVYSTILRLQGLFIKVGQLLSIMANFLPAQFRAGLEALQDQVPPSPYHEIAARIDAAYRAELAQAIPLARDDSAYGAEQAHLAAVWLFTCLSWRLDAALASDVRWGTWSIRGRLLFYLEAVIAMCDAANVLPGITAAASAWLRDLRHRWSASVFPDRDRAHRVLLTFVGWITPGANTGGSASRRRDIGLPARRFRPGHRQADLGAQPRAHLRDRRVDLGNPAGPQEEVVLPLGQRAQL